MDDNVDGAPSEPLSSLQHKLLSLLVQSPVDLGHAVGCVGRGTETGWQADLRDRRFQRGHTATQHPGTREVPWPSANAVRPE